MLDSKIHEPGYNCSHSLANKHYTQHELIHDLIHLIKTSIKEHLHAPHTYVDSKSRFETLNLG